MARAAPSSFDLVFLDPPFDSALAAPALAAAARVVAPDGWIYLEQPQPLQADAALQVGLRVVRQGRAGAVHFHLLRRGDTDDPGKGPVSDSAPVKAPG